MAATMKTIQAWVVIDEDGDYEVGTDQENAGDRYAENVTEAAGHARRVICVTLQLPLPTTVQVQVRATLPEESGEVTASVE